MSERREYGELPEEAGARIDDLDGYLGRTIEEGRPIEALVAIRAIGIVVSRRVKEAGRAASDGAWSWADVGDALGISKQAAHQKLSRRLLAVNERLDRRAETGHEKVSRRFQHARETVKKHAAARDPERAQAIQKKLDARERAGHDRVNRHIDEARERLKRHGRRKG